MPNNEHKIFKKIHFSNNLGEHNSLLGRHSNHGASNSDVSTQLCEIDDSECEQDNNLVPPASTKKVKWSNSVQQTQV